MTVREIDDEWWQLVVGRLDEKDAKVYEALVEKHGGRSNRRWKQHFDRIARRQGRHTASLIKRGYQWRADFRFMRRGTLLSPKEVVVKSVSNAKTRRDIRSTIDYVARIGKSADEQEYQQRPVIYDELGRVIEPEKIAQVLGRWGLLEDEDNLSKPACELKVKDGPAAVARLPKDKRFWSVQGWHLVFSIDEDLEEIGGAADALKRATMATVDEVFASDGYRVLWCLHRDTPSHPHIHIVLSAVSRFGHRIRFDHDGEYFFAIRVAFAKHLHHAGLSYDATCREDRSELRWRILSGEAPLRVGTHLRDRKRPSAALGDRAPDWYHRFGAEISRRSRERRATGDGRRGGRSSLLTALFKRSHRKRKNKERERMMLPEDLRDAEEALAGVYQEPGAALIRWMSFVAEGAYRNENGELAFPNMPVACWYFRRRPEVFGEPMNDLGSLGHHKIVERILNRIPLSEYVDPNSIADAPPTFPKIRSPRQDRNEDIEGVIKSRMRLASWVAYSGADLDELDRNDKQQEAFRIVEELLSEITTSAGPASKKPRRQHISIVGKRNAASDRRTTNAAPSGDPLKNHRRQVPRRSGKEFRSPHGGRGIER